MIDLGPINDPERLKALQATGLLDSPPETAFDQITRIAAKLLDAPSAFVTLIDSRRQYIKSAHNAGLASGSETTLDESFCKFTVASGNSFLVEDARENDLVRASPAVANGVMAYAGVPLKTADGHSIGALCVIDSRPRNWSGEDISSLEVLVRSAMSLIEERRAELRRDADGGKKQRPLAALMRAIEQHFGALDAYQKCLDWKDGKLDLDAEAATRRAVENSGAQLRSAFLKIHEGPLGPNELRAHDQALLAAIAAYLEAEDGRKSADASFSSGSTKLPHLQDTIARAMEAENALRLAAFNSGAQV